jgi:hypothetical protein
MHGVKLLAANSPILRMRYEITNLGPLPLELIWGMHPALPAQENLILRISAKTGIVDQATDPRLGAPGQRYVWRCPAKSDSVVGMSRVHDVDAKVACGHYGVDLKPDGTQSRILAPGNGFC